MALERKQFTYTPFTYKEYEKSADVQAAEAKQKEIENAVANYGDFVWADQDKYNTLLSNYENRPDFTYDFNADALYQQYKDKYIQQGKMAMADTMGQAAAMTGGYGNSYAQTVGNQAYQASLQNLNDVIPQLYQMAYDRYNQKGQDMLNMIGLLSGERDYALGRYNDGYDKLVNDRTYYSTEAQNAFNRDYGMYSADREIAQGEHGNTEEYKYQDVADANAFAQWLEEQALNERQVDLTERQVALQEKEHSAKYDTSTKEYSGTTKTGGSYNNGGLTAAQVKELQTALGVDADGYYGDGSKSAAGGLSAEEAYNKFVGGAKGPPYEPQNTKAVTNFQAGIKTKNEFNGRGGADKQKYKTYSAYIEGKLDEWLSKGMLNEQEVATLLTYYGL